MLRVENLTKKFKKVTAVDNVSFEVNPGEIIGLLGENGAGKTTTLRMLATMLKPTSGNAIKLWCEKTGVSQDGRSEQKMIDFINEYEYEAEDTNFCINPITFG